MSNFRERPERELQLLSDDELIAYVRAAAAAGSTDAAKSALAILVHGHMDNVRRRVAMKVPAIDADDVAGNAMVSAIASAFNGQSAGEFHAWLNRIVKRRIADYHRKGRLDVVPIPDPGDDEQWGDEPSVEPEGEAIDLERAVDGVFSELSDEHARVVDLYVFDDLPAAEVAARVEGMTEQNVHQIASRFRKRLRELLEEGDTSP